MFEARNNSLGLLVKLKRSKRQSAFKYRMTSKGRKQLQQGKDGEKMKWWRTRKNNKCSRYKPSPHWRSHHQTKCPAFPWLMLWWVLGWVHWHCRSWVITHKYQKLRNDTYYIIWLCSNMKLSSYTEDIQRKRILTFSMIDWLHLFLSLTACKCLWWAKENVSLSCFPHSIRE